MIPAHPSKADRAVIRRRLQNLAAGPSQIWTGSFVRPTPCFHADFLPCLLLLRLRSSDQLVGFAAHRRSLLRRQGRKIIEHTCEQQHSYSVCWLCLSYPSRLFLKRWTSRGWWKVSFTFQNNPMRGRLVEPLPLGNFTQVSTSQRWMTPRHHTADLFACLLFLR